MHHRVFFRLKACPRCGGDILVDRVFEDDDICIHNTRPQNQLEKTVIVVNGQANSKVKEKM